MRMLRIQNARGTWGDQQLMHMVSRTLRRRRGCAATMRRQRLRSRRGWVSGSTVNKRRLVQKVSGNFTAAQGRNCAKRSASKSVQPVRATEKCDDVLQRLSIAGRARIQLASMVLLAGRTHLSHGRKVSTHFLSGMIFCGHQHNCLQVTLLMSS
jgi:hypothetical protein